MDWKIRRNFVKLQHCVLPALQKPRLQWVIPLGVMAAIIFTLWTLFRSQEPQTSAVGCKSKIAQIVLPHEKDRTEYLTVVGKDMQNIEEDYFSFVERITFMCSHQVTVGPEGDGGWDVCVDGQFDIRSPCLVYSFGMNVASHQYSERGHFYDIGLDNVNRVTIDGRWQLHRLKTIMKDLGHEGKTIDYMKMDIEFSEWPALYDILQSGVIHQIRQLAMEVHTPEMDKHWRPDSACTWCRWDTLSFMLRTLIDLHNAGMSLYYSRTNYRIEFISALTRRHRYCCYNLHFVNTKFDRDIRGI
ncbi:hypothetical protein LSAT2_008834 [Lamellibrachia satsuma]|nr:hypothetical protein LSAT2_008834 [Lamellibrachia satsuma]